VLHSGDRQTEHSASHAQEALTMEYLVTMTTRVPDGTTDQEVSDVRAREAAHSAGLAAQGHLLRLFRPPLKPGEWRTFGLFAADDADRLEEVLAAMPLRVWRTDEVTPLLPNPDDPGLRGGPGSAGQPGAPGVPAGASVRAPAGASVRAQAGASAGSGRAPEFLTTFTLAVPEGTPAQALEDARARERERARELAGQGHLERLWTLGPGRALGLWRAADAAEMQAILTSLPLDPFMTVQTTPLTEHPGDPAIAGM
jgi:muconolactone delta-isomerase